MPDKKPHPRRGLGIWSGTVTFGLVSIPVALLPAHRAGGPRFRMLAPDGTPLARRWVCSADGAALTDEDVVRGFAVRPEKYVLVTDDELRALEPEKSRDIRLEEFVSCDDVDPLYFERAYYLAPTGQSTKAYSLLARVMERTARAGIATFVMHDREYVVALLAKGGILRAETLRFADEVRTPADVGLPAPRKAEARRVTALAREVARLTAASFDTAVLRDEYAARVAAAAKKKRDQGRDVVETTPAEDETETVDLMSALRQALGRRGGSRRASATRRAGAGGRTGARRKGKRGAA